MCFSATASFVASAAISGTGAATLKASKKELLPIALIPLLFGLQQFLEGIQWLFISSVGPSTFFGYAFLFFAFLLWPIYLPLAVYSVEKNTTRKKLLKGVIVIGAMVTSGLLFALLTNPLEIEVINKHITYRAGAGATLLGVSTYALATVGSLLLSSRVWIQLFGVAGLIAAIVSWTYFEVSFESVWCFFAAVLTIFLYFVVRKNDPVLKSSRS